MLSSLPASIGSEPSTFTTVSLLTFSSASARCSLMTMSGTDGSSTRPCDNSCASALTKPNTTVFGIARVSIVLVASACSYVERLSQRVDLFAGFGQRRAAGGGVQPHAARRRHAGEQHLLGRAARARALINAPLTVSTSVEIGGAGVFARRGRRSRRSALTISASISQLRRMACATRR